MSDSYITGALSAFFAGRNDEGGKNKKKRKGAKMDEEGSGEGKRAKPSSALFDKHPERVKGDSETPWIAREKSAEDDGGRGKKEKKKGKKKEQERADSPAEEAPSTPSTTTPNPPTPLQERKQNA